MSLILQIALGLLLGVILINLLPALIVALLALVGVSVAAVGLAANVAVGLAFCLIPIGIVYQSYDVFGLIGAGLVILIGYGAGTWLNKNEKPKKLTILSSIQTVLMGWLLIYVAILGSGLWFFFRIIPLILGSAIAETVFLGPLGGDLGSVWSARTLGAAMGLVLVVAYELRMRTVKPHEAPPN